jgi:hypothetical protein
MYFPRLFQVRGLVAEKQGRQEEAQRNYGLFGQLSGELPR